MFSFPSLCQRTRYRGPAECNTRYRRQSVRPKEKKRFRPRLELLEERVVPSAPGDIEWVRQFGTVLSERAQAAYADGNVYAAGYTDDALPGETNAGGRDAFVRKYDANGTELWTRQLGSVSNDAAHSIAVDASGVYVAGFTDGLLPGQTSAGGRDVFVRKYDANGTEVWTRQFGTSTFDEGHAISVDASGVYVAGLTLGTFTGQTSAGGIDVFVRKYDANGAEVWTRQFGTSSFDEVGGIAVDASGVYLTGKTEGTLPGQTSAGGSSDAYVRKYDANGTEVWTRQFGTSTSEDSRGIAVDASGVYVAGFTDGTLPGQTSVGGSSDAYVRKYDANGTEVWTRQFGTSSFDNAFGISADASGVYVAGETGGILPGEASAGGPDAFVRKYDAGGTEVWTTQFGSALSDRAIGISVDGSGVYVTGRTLGVLPGQTSAGGEDAFVAKLTDNQPPTIAAQSFNVDENQTAVGTVAASDPDAGDTLTYSVSGGDDAAHFTIDSSTGALSFLSAPDFETPADADADNVYELQITVTDSNGASSSATITVNVLNLASITGVVFADVNGNGLFEANEPGIDGVTIELLDGSGNQVLDSGGSPITALTSDGGLYLLEDLVPATYRLHEVQPTGVDDGDEILGSLGGSIVANDTMELTLERIDATDYVFAELGQQVSSGDTATIGFWHNKHGQALIAQGGAALADWLTTNFGNVFGNTFNDSSGGDDGAEVAAFFNNELFKQKAKKSAGPAKVDAQFMATALATYFTSSNLAGTIAAGYGFNVTDTGIGTNVVNVGSNSAAFNVADGTDLTIMQLLLATNDLTDVPDGLSGFAHIYDTNGDGVIDANEAALRAQANAIYSTINEVGAI